VSPARIETLALIASDGVVLNQLRAVCDNPAARPGAVVVLIPGWCMPAAIWRDTMLALAARHEVIALDPRGQGDSEIPVHGYHIDQRADDLARCVNQFDRVVMVAWSLGALEALHYVHRHGEFRLAGLAIVDSSVGEDPAIPAAKAFREELATDRGGAVERFVRAMFHSPRSEADIADLTRSALQMPLEASLALFPRHLPREHWRGLARGLRAPLLYAVTPQFKEQAENLQRARPATRVEIFPDAGHALFLDETARFNALLEGFIEMLPGQ
jgi:non-heme chloroperoxidase